MAVWDVSSAISSLRSLLGDNATDKFEFKVDVFPTPDGVTTRFFVGQTRLVEGTLQAYINRLLAVTGVGTSGVVDIAYEKGSFDLGTAPSGHMNVQASFYYQWFTDAELTSFLTAAANILNVEFITDPSLAIGVRGAALDFACYYAYMKKAAEYADSLTAQAAGYQFDQSKSHPNWRELAKTALAAAKEKLKLFEDSLIGVAPAMAFVTYRLPKWQGP